MKRMLVALVAALLGATPALAQSEQDVDRLEQRAEDIVAAMSGEGEYRETFADLFVSAVPESQFITIKAQLESQFGALIGVEQVDPLGPASAAITIRFERGLASGQFSIEDGEPHEVTGFVLRDIRAINDSTDQLLAEIAALPGETGVLIAPLGQGAQPLAASNADRQFGLGSTFKLYVLSALGHAIARGEHSWDEVVPLTQRSYPSGQLQDWPQGSPLTLHTLATLMISISDNTATDQLIAVLGREAVEAELVASGHSDPARSIPFLTTREMFLMKSVDNVDPGEYVASGTERRRELLEFLSGVDAETADVLAAFTGGPNALDIEWFASPDDLAGVLRRIVALEDQTLLDVLAVNPAISPAMQDEWAYAGYKGGSEPGVLNLTWLLRHEAGQWQVVTLSWNDTENPVDEQAFELLAMRAIALASAD